MWSTIDDYGKVLGSKYNSNITKYYPQFLIFFFFTIWLLTFSCICTKYKTRFLVNNAEKYRFFLWSAHHMLWQTWNLFYLKSVNFVIGIKHLDAFELHACEQSHGFLIWIILLRKWKFYSSNAVNPSWKGLEKHALTEALFVQLWIRTTWRRWRETPPSCRVTSLRPTWASWSTWFSGTRGTRGSPSTATTPDRWAQHFRKY